VTEDSMNVAWTWINVIFTGGWWDLQWADPLIILINCCEKNARLCVLPHVAIFKSDLNVT
jgi:hypothetical protein